MIYPQLDRLKDLLKPWLLSFGASCRVYNDAAISHSSSGSWQYLTFNSEVHDTDTMHSTSSNTGRITFNKGGVYVVSGHIEFASNATGIRGISIRLGGSTFIAINSTTAINGTTHALSISTIRQFSATNYIELGAYQNSGGALNVNSSSAYTPYFAAARIA